MGLERPWEEEHGAPTHGPGQACSIRGPLGVLYFLIQSVFPAACGAGHFTSCILVSAGLIDLGSGSAPVGMGCPAWSGPVSTTAPIPGQVRFLEILCLVELHTLPCSRPGGGSEKGCCPACVRVGLALFKQSGSSCKLPNTYFGRSAWPAAGAFHYFGDISLNMLQFLHSQLRPQSQPQSCLDTRGALAACLAPEQVQGRNRRC